MRAHFILIIIEDCSNWSYSVYHCHRIFNSIWCKEYKSTSVRYRYYSYFRVHSPFLIMIIWSISTLSCYENVRMYHKPMSCGDHPFWNSVLGQGQKAWSWKPSAFWPREWVAECQALPRWQWQIVNSDNTWVWFDLALTIYTCHLYELQKFNALYYHYRSHIRSGSLACSEQQAYTYESYSYFLFHSFVVIAIYGWILLICVLIYCLLEIVFSSILYHHIFIHSDSTNIEKYFKSSGVRPSTCIYNLYDTPR